MELKIINSNDLGNFYKHVNKHSVHKTGIGPLKSATGTLALGDHQKAELLNSYFVSVCTVDNGVLPPLPDLTTIPNNKQLENFTFNRTQIFKILKNLNQKTSSGPDGLLSIHFRQLASSLAIPLSMIFYLIMEAGKVPEIWKKVIVVPV